MMRSLFIKTLLFGMIVAIFAVIAMPASWLRLLLPQAWPLQMVSASGTLWNGSALLAIGSAGRERTINDPVRWHLAWAGGPMLIVQHPWLERELRVAPGWRGWQIPGQSLKLPASVLNTLHATLNAVSPGGDITLQWPDLPRSAAKGANTFTPYTLTWRHASSALATVRPLGSYQLTATPQPDNHLQLNLNTQDGALQLDGRGTWSAATGLRFEGTAQARPEYAAALQEMLSALGPQRGAKTLLKFP